MKKKGLTNLEKYDLYRDAFKNLKNLKKEGDYFKAFILAFSILEDRVTVAYENHITIMGLNTRRERDLFSVIAKAKVLFLSKCLKKEDYDSLSRIARSRNNFYHKYFMADIEIDKKVVEEITRLIRVVDKKVKLQKRTLKKVNSEQLANARIKERSKVSASN